MTNFINDGTALNAAKADLVPIGGNDPTKFVAATDWNQLRQSLLDIQAYALTDHRVFDVADKTKYAVIEAYNGNPNGVLSRRKGSVVFDYTTPATYQNQDGSTTWQSIGGINSSIGFAPYGDGSDSNVVISVNTTLTRDMYYNNLIVNNGITLRTGGYRVHVAGMLTLNGVICNDGYAGQNGNAVSTAFGGAGGDAAGQGFGGSAGGNGGFNGGAANGSGSNPAPRGMTAGGNGGFGGAGGGNGGSPLIVTTNGDIRSLFSAYFAKFPGTLTTNINFGSGGGGGHSNAAGVGGGAGGGGGGYCYVAARTWTGAGSTTSNGGKGGDAQASGSVASGGGGGGSGGWVTFVTQMATAPTLLASGGVGGARSGFGGSTNGSTGNNGYTIAFNA